MPLTNAAGRALIERSEGCALRAYPDPGSPLARTGEGSGDPWTIGFGHTGYVGSKRVCEGMTITREQADNLLEADLHNIERQVNNLCTITLNSNQFSALVSFAYNVGVGELRGSMVMQLINQRQFERAMEHLKLYTHDESGEVLDGLVIRREAEAALFMEPMEHDAAAN